MSTNYILFAVVLGVGVLMLASPYLVKLFGSIGGWFKRSPTEPAPVGPSHKAYDAAVTLIEHYEKTGDTEGERLAREAAAHLFHQGPHA